MSRASFCNLFYRFQQLLKYAEFMYDVLSWLQEFYIATFFFFTYNFSLQLLSSRPIAQNAKCYLKKHALELFQYSCVLLDNRLELNSDLKAIAEMTRPNISKELAGKLWTAKQLHAVWV